MDYSNGRFCKTPEFPLGTYAYFAGITTGSAQTLPSFPYFVGDRFKNNFIKENRTLNQSFNFNNSSLIRNTLPYKINDEYADNDFIIESNEIINQKCYVKNHLFIAIKQYFSLNFDFFSRTKNWKKKS